MLKWIFASKIENNETVDTYLDLIYGTLIISENMREDGEEEKNIEEESDDSSSTNDDNDIPTVGNR